MRSRPFKTLLLAAVASGLSIAPGSLTAAEKHPPAEVIDRVSKLLRLVCDQLWVENDRFWHNGQYRRCIATMRIIADLDPHDIDAFRDTAWLLWNEDEGDDAIAFYEKGISLNPDSYELYYDFGTHYFNLKRYDDAVRVLESALVLNPPSVVWRLLAHAYERSGRLQDSTAMWERLKTLDPDDPAIERNLSRVREKAARTDVPGAPGED